MKFLGFLIKSQVSDDAVRLKALSDLTLQTYVTLGRQDLEQTLARDFPTAQFSVDGAARFVFTGFPHFQFTIDGQDSFMVNGRSGYSGFRLYVQKAGELWSASASNSTFHASTGAAKQLARTMQKKYGVMDMTEELSRWQ